MLVYSVQISSNLAPMTWLIDFDFETVYQDAASRNLQEVDTEGYSLKLEYDMGDYSFISVTGYESAEIFLSGRH